MKKILVISNIYPSKKDVVYGIFVKNFINSLENTPDLSINTIVIKGRNYTLFDRIRKYLIFYLEILYKVLFKKYDLIYVHIITHATPPLRLISYIKKLPLVFNIHGEDLLTQTKLATYLLKLAIPLIKEAKMIVVPSYFFKIKTMEYLPFINQNKIFISPSGGINNNIFKPTIRKNKEITIGYISRIDRGKGWDILLKSIVLLKNKGITPKVIFAGSGTEITLLKKMRDDLMLENVEYLGIFDQDELSSIYNNLDLFIFPTMLEESLGLVAIEAMACGCPIIGSKIGGLTDYIKENINGYYFEPGNAVDLAQKIQLFLSLSEKQKNEFKSNAIITSKEYDAKIISMKLNQKLLDIIN